MTPERWERVKSVFDRAVECDPGLRSQLIRDNCGNDEELRREVESLLACDQPTGSLVGNFGIENPAVPAGTVSASLPLAPGSALGPRYTIVSKLGAGGMGVVYNAHDRDLDRIVALKVLSPAIAANSGAMQRFKQEVLLASRISHKNIVRTHDIGEAEPVRFLTMAYVEGEDLQEFLKRRGRLPPEEVIGIARQIAGALEAAHNEGVVHRDLKPRNVLLDKQGQVYVSDFGLAKSFGQDDISLTQVGEVMGTPRYMAPEQMEGKPADQRTDIYAFGLILYEMVTGESPFEAPGALFKRFGERPSSPRRIAPDIPASLENIILRCLEPDPVRRYQKARDVLNDLETGRVPRVRRLHPRPRRRVIIIIVATAVVLCAGIAAVVPAVRERAVTILPAAWRSRFERSVSLAVLPFTYSGDEAQKHLAEGVADSLSARLFPLRGVHLAPHSTVETLLARGSSPEAVAHEMGVALLLRGAYQQVGDKISVSLHLDDVKSGKTIWEEVFDGAAQDLLALQVQMYTRLLDALKLHPNTYESARSLTAFTADATAYDLYLKGQSLIRRQRDAKTVQQALDFYNAAVEKDRSFALAYAAIADACLFMHDAKQQPEWIERALGAARNAEQLNDSLPEPHLSMAGVAVAKGKHAEALAELRRAAELAPGSDDVYRRLGTAYRDSGEYKNAIEALRHAVTINPYYWYNHNQLGSALISSGDPASALEEFRQVVTLRPNASSGWTNVGVAHFKLGKWDQVIEDFNRALAIQPTPGLYQNLGVAYFYSARYNDARAACEKALKLNPDSYSTVGTLADALLASGLKEQAYAAYRKAIDLAVKELQANPNNASVLGFTAVYAAELGDHPKANQWIAQARTLKPDDPTVLWQQAYVDALAGRREQTITDIRNAVEKGFSAPQILATPEFRSLLGKDLEKTVSASARPQ
jgi:serine/threonine-protein kinase